MNILFVCSNNLHRGPTAEGYFRQLQPGFKFKSVGIDKESCQRHSTEFCTKQTLEWADWIFAMEAQHLMAIARYGDYSEITVNLNIEDIYTANDKFLINLLSDHPHMDWLHDDIACLTY